MKPKHWAVFNLTEYVNVAKALYSCDKKRQFLPITSAYFIVVTINDMWVTHWDTLHGHLQEKDKDKIFAVEVIFCPLWNMYLYTDIDIFKDIFFPFLWSLRWRKNENELKQTLGSFGDLVRRMQEAVGTPKRGTGAKGRLKTALKTNSLFDYWHLCNGNGLWNQWTCVRQREVVK